MTYPLVWTEREYGDFEACVIAAGLMAIMYGGWYKFPFGAYTQQEREELEKLTGAGLDNPTNFSGMNKAFQARYGIQLRALSTGTLAAALSRIGVGLLLAGKFQVGAIMKPTIPGTEGAFTHASFFVPLGNYRVLYYDPLDPNKAEPRVVTVEQVLKWAKGADSNSAREVRQWEFGTLPAGVMMVIRPVREDWITKTGNSTPGGQFYLEGPGTGVSKYFLTPEPVTSVAESTDGTYRLVFYYNGGATGGEYLWMPRANLNPVAGTRDPATGFAKELPGDADCSQEVQDATLALKAELAAAKLATQAAEARVATLQQVIRDHNAVEDKMRAIGS